MSELHQCDFPFFLYSNGPYYASQADKMILSALQLSDGLLDPFKKAQECNFLYRVIRDYCHTVEALTKSLQPAALRIPNV